MPGRISARLSCITASLVILAAASVAPRGIQAQAPPTPPPSGFPAAAAPRAGAGLTAAVTDPEGLNLRSGPGTQYAVLARIPTGTTLPILAERQSVNWLPVMYQNTHGFVHDAYVTLQLASAGLMAATPTAPARPAAPATPAPSDDGMSLLGVFLSDSDHQITIADEVQLVVAIRPPSGVTKVTLRASGAPFLTASRTLEVRHGDNWLWIPDFRVDTEREPVLREAVVRTVGGSLPVRDGALVLAIDFTDGAGRSRTATFEPTVFEAANPTRVARIEYPNLSRVTGLPPRGAGIGGYYLQGDTDFHHPDDAVVRALALEAGRLGGVWPDSPAQVADNVFTSINRLLGDGEPGDFNNDSQIARLIEQGTITRGQRNGAYICIGQAYLMTALTRTLGIPSREMNLTVGRPSWRGSDGVWRVDWWQEGAAQTWYDGRWNHYDLWLGFKGLEGYFRENLAYQAWAAFDRRATPFMTVGGINTGLRGHNFNAWPGNPAQWEFLSEASRPGTRVVGIPDATWVTAVGMQPDADAYRDLPGSEPVRVLRGPALQIARPPTTTIRQLPDAP